MRTRNPHFPCAARQCLHQVTILRHKDTQRLEEVFFMQRLRGQTSYFCAHRLDVEGRLVGAEGVCGVALEKLEHCVMSRRVSPPESRVPRVGAPGGISICRVGSRLWRRKGRKGSEGRERSSPTYELPLADGSLRTPDARVGSWRLAERLKVNWAWVLR